MLNPAHKNILTLEKNEIQELQLNLINEKHKVYASVIDINLPQNNLVKSKWESGIESTDLELKILLSIAFIHTISWKSNRQVIQLNIDSDFEEQGISNNISEIKPLKTS